MATQLQEPQPDLVSHNGGQPGHRNSETSPGFESDGRRPKLETKASTEAKAREKKPLEFLAALKRNRRVALVVAAILVLVASASGWVYFTSYESTDDAQVDGHLHPVSARISGTILRVNPEVQDSHFVQAGTVLAEIDPADFAAERDRAQANYDRLKANSPAAANDITVTSSGSQGRLELATASVTEAEESVASEKASLQAAEARSAQADANFARAEADRQRYEPLLAKHEISQSEYDRVATEAATDREAVTAARAEILAAQKRITQAESRLAERKADLLAAG